MEIAAAISSLSHVDPFVFIRTLTLEHPYTLPLLFFVVCFLLTTQSEVFYSSFAKSTPAVVSQAVASSLRDRDRDRDWDWETVRRLPRANVSHSVQMMCRKIRPRCPTDWFPYSHPAFDMHKVLTIFTTFQYQRTISNSNTRKCFPFTIPDRIVDSIMRVASLYSLSTVPLIGAWIVFGIRWTGWIAKLAIVQ